MKVEGYLFLGCAVFFGGSDLVYWHFSHDPTGTTALALSVALAFLSGFYVLFTGRRLPKRPEDDLAGEIQQGTGEVGFSARTAGGRSSWGCRLPRGRGRGGRLVDVPDRAGSS